MRELIDCRGSCSSVLSKPGLRNGRAETAGLPVTTNVSTLEDALVWLESQAPGVLLLHVASVDAPLDSVLCRIAELHPSEVVIAASGDPDAKLYRAAMRGGAFDFLPFTAPASEFLTALRGAAERHARLRAMERRAASVAEARVRRHEREAASRMVEAVTMTGAWADLDVTLRRRWLGRYLHAAHGQDPAARQAFLADVGAELETQPHAGEVLLSLHIHALIGDRAARAAGAERARDLLVDLLVRTLDARAPAGVVLPSGPGDTAGTSWHRWTWAGTEYWWLARDGRVDAFILLDGGEPRGVWLEDDELTSARLPPLPEALRCIERRLGCGYVLDVESRAA